MQIRLVKFQEREKSWRSVIIMNIDLEQTREKELM